MSATELLKNDNGFFTSNLFLGTVVSANPATFVIEVAPDGQQSLNKIQGIPLAQAFATTLGFKEISLPTIGSRVLCHGLRGHHALILGTIPMSECQGDGNVALSSKTVLNAEEPVHDSVHRLGYLNDITKLNVINNQLPTDIVQGDKVIANEFGLQLSLFQLVAMLRASDLAQVQCHFLDDLVRIVSHNFQHYTALGSLSVSHDGKTINLEAGLTHSPDESIGNTQSEYSINPVDPADTTADNQFYQLTDGAVALERLKIFVGKLGGFVNLLLSLPTNEIHTMDGTLPKTPDQGLLQLKAGLDGSLIVRSANGIYLEKTNWIRVPQRIRTPEDPLGDDGTTVDYPNKKAFTFKADHTYRDVAFLYYLQLKDYLAYANEELGYADFNALPKDFYVNNDPAKNTLANNSTIMVDPVTGASYQRTKSVIALMPNGGICLSDTWGSCISMEGGNIYIQPAKDLVLQPNRNLIGKVGGNVSLAARQDLDLSSTSGGLRIKTNGPQYLYSDQDGILLHANGQPKSAGILTSSGVTQSVPGIVFHAPNSTIVGDGQQVYFNAAESLVLGGPEITITSTEWLRLYSKQALTFNSNILESTTNSTTVIYSKNQALFVGLGSTAVATKDQTIAAGPMGGVKGFLDPAKDQKAFFDSLNKVNTDANNFALKSVLSVFTDPAKFSDIKFQFQSSDYYGITNADVVPQTMAQQQANFMGYPTIKWLETPVNGTYPYPGAIAGVTAYPTVTTNNMTTYNNELINKVTSLVTEGGTVTAGNLFKDYTIIL